MYIVYCQNKPKSEHIVSEYIDTYFEVSFTPPSLAPGLCYSGDKVAKQKKTLSLTRT